MSSNQMVTFTQPYRSGTKTVQVCPDDVAATETMPANNHNSDAQLVVHLKGGQVLSVCFLTLPAAEEAAGQLTRTTR